MQSRAKGWRKRQAVQFCKLGCLPFYYPSLDGIRFVCSGVGGSPLIILFVCLGNVLLEGNGEGAERRRARRLPGMLLGVTGPWVTIWVSQVRVAGLGNSLLFSV